MIDVPGLAEVWAALPEARIVGGAVRDTLAKRDVADVDMASPLTPEAVMQRLSAARIKTIPTGLAHGTVTAVAAGRGFEITTLRRDVTTDGRHAEVAFTDDWQEDAARRDFTINAMSLNRVGTVFDYFGGREDLAAGRVRFVGAALPRIREDYLRILRFFRFFARYGKGPADQEALAAICAAVDGIARLSVERIWSEIKALLRAPAPGGAVALMQETGVLPAVFPNPDFTSLQTLLARDAPVDPLLRVAALWERDVAGFAERLKLSGEESDILAALAHPNLLLPETDDAGLRRALASEDPAVLTGRTWLGQTDAADWDGLRQRITTMQRPVFPLQGRDVTALGVSPGPDVGALLARTKVRWMDGGCIADAPTCRIWLNEEIRRYP